MSPEMRFTPPRRASRRIAGFVMPWMLSRSTFLCRFAPPLPSPLPPLPRPDISAALSLPFPGTKMDLEILFSVAWDWMVWGETSGRGYIELEEGRGRRWIGERSA
uniref:Uncharacterized protein n=1 Tax=Triticum urartu TaxID=4572 RepID=A0A8R7UAB5_TRIUA